MRVQFASLSSLLSNLQMVSILFVESSRLALSLPPHCCGPNSGIHRCPDSCLPVNLSAPSHAPCSSQNPPSVPTSQPRHHPALSPHLPQLLLTAGALICLNFQHASGPSPHLEGSSHLCPFSAFPSAPCGSMGPRGRYWSGGLPIGWCVSFLAEVRRRGDGRSPCDVWGGVDPPPQASRLHH